MVRITTDAGWKKEMARGFKKRPFDGDKKRTDKRVEIMGKQGVAQQNRRDYLSDNPAAESVRRVGEYKTAKKK